MVLGGTVAYGAATSTDVACTITENTLSCPLPASPAPVTVTESATVTAPPVTVTAPPVTVTATVTSTVAPPVSTSPPVTTTAATTSAPPVAGANLNLDWDTCDTSQWTATGWGSLEAGSQPAHQSVVVSDVRRVPTGCANRFEIHNNATDINTGFRALWSRYDSQEGTVGGTDFVWGLSFRVSAVPAYAAVWELHHRSNIYSIDNDLALAPHAVMIRNGQLQYREMTGAGVWSGGQWTGYSNYQDQKVLLPTVAANTWYDVLIRVKTSEGADGLTQVYAKPAGQAWPSVPSWQNAGPSLPFVPGGLDPKVPNKISVSQPGAGASLTGLYVTVGMYTGSNSWAQPTSQVYTWVDQLRRYPDLVSAKAGWPTN